MTGLTRLSRQGWTGEYAPARCLGLCGLCRRGCRFGFVWGSGDGFLSGFNGVTRFGTLPTICINLFMI